MFPVHFHLLLLFSLYHFHYFHFHLLHLLSFHFIFHFFVLFLFVFFYLIITLHRFSVVNVVLVFNNSLIAVAPDSPILLAVHFHLLLLFSPSFSLFSFHLLYLLSFSFIFHSFVLFLFPFYLSSHSRFSSVNVVLVFNNSLIAFAPDSPKKLSFHFRSLSLFSLVVIPFIHHHHNPASSKVLWVIFYPINIHLFMYFSLSLKTLKHNRVCKHFFFILPLPLS